MFVLELFIFNSLFFSFLFFFFFFLDLLLSLLLLKFSRYYALCCCYCFYSLRVFWEHFYITFVCFCFVFGGFGVVAFFILNYYLLLIFQYLSNVYNCT